MVTIVIAAVAFVDSQMALIHTKHGHESRFGFGFTVFLSSDVQFSLKPELNKKTCIPQVQLIDNDMHSISKAVMDSTFLAFTTAPLSFKALLKLAVSA